MWATRARFLHTWAEKIHGNISSSPTLYIYIEMLETGEKTQGNISGDINVYITTLYIQLYIHTDALSIAHFRFLSSPSPTACTYVFMWSTVSHSLLPFITQSFLILPPPPSFPFRHLLGCTTLHLSWRGFDVRVYVYYYVTYLHTYLSIDLSIRYPGSYIHLSLTVSFSLCIYRINRQHYSPATQARHKTTFSTPPPQLSHPTSPPAHAAAPAPPLPNSEKDPKQCTQES